jgi:stearoyl-CoA desaturase (delta-9 desaturase)
VRISQQGGTDQSGDASELVQPVEHETADRIITGLVTAIPFLLLAVAAWQVWDQALHWRDLAILGAAYVVTALGITIGFHRLLTHRSFKTGPVLRGIFAALGSAAIEGPVISWVADHRKHHAFSDERGDPHSPHVGHGGGWRGTLRGLFHAHMGWLFIHTERGAKSRFAPDLINDPVIRAVDRTFLLWAVVGLAIPFAAGYWLGGTLVAGLTAMLWGGAVRVFLLHHATYSINSVCHVFGRRRFATKDESRNVFWLALPTMGEAWHNNHHAFPTSAAHGMRPWELDPSAIVIRALEWLGLAWDVTRISPDRQAAKRSGQVPAG